MEESDLEARTAKEYTLYRAGPTPLKDRLFRSSVFCAFAGVSWLIREHTAEHFSLKGFEEVFNPEQGEQGEQGEEGIKPPYLILLQHTTWYDFSNMLPVWFQFPSGHTFNAVTRRDYFPKIPPLNALVNGLAGAVSLPVYGMSSGKADSPEEREKRSRMNREVQEQVIAAYAKGISISLAPEGTSKGNGRISPIKAGAYHYSHFTTADGAAYAVPCVPIGVTYDFLSGKEKNGKRKQRVFARIGQPFMYSPVPRREREEPKAYEHRDKEAFNRKTRDAYIDLNTITAAQLASIFIYDKLERGQRTTTVGEFQIGIQDMVANLAEMPDVYLDQFLLDKEERKERLFLLYHALIQEGYLAPTSYGQHSICQSRAEQEPPLATFKKENILLHTYNKIAEVMEERAEIREAIRSAL
ncbi:hypothetical protein HZA99_04615 [Candidatus Woesearchaeota archaeon]|nr:hypothetical protein [Candidatus Woesearchaeota archaeon]